MSRWVVWGLRERNHTHRYIHQSFFRALSRTHDAVWLEDEEVNTAAVRPGDVVIVCGIAQKYVPKLKEVAYVLHNVSPELRRDLNALSARTLNLQVWTKAAQEYSVIEARPCLRWDASSRTLYQPWGVPWEVNLWRSPTKGRARLMKWRREYWIGTVWDNSDLQGNSRAINLWRQALSRLGVSFVQARRVPDRPSTYGFVTRRSAVGSAIVGEWQAAQEYAPCRVFKNLAVGVMPNGNNSVYKSLFGETAIVRHDLDELAETVLTMSRKEYSERTAEAQRELRAFTYARGIQRITEHLYA